MVPSLPAPVPMFSPVEVTPAGYVAAANVDPTVFIPFERISL